MSKPLIIGQHGDIGGREVYEDRGAADEITTRGGLTLTVGVVCDGVGGANKGERAAQLAIDTVMKSIAASTQREVPEVLINAVEAANLAVYREILQTGISEMACTMALAVIHEDTLFIANVGDSRIYFLREDRLTQLTTDHVNAQGALVRAIGIADQVAVDIGFYVGTDDESVAEQRGWSGLPLKQGDSVLLCSDGLIKFGPTGEPYTSDDEIKRTLMTKEGQKAAAELVSYALGRNADDNVTVVLLQTPDPRRQNRANRLRLAVTLAVTSLVVLLVLAGIFAFLQTGQLNEVQAAASQAARETGTAIAQGALDATGTASAIPTPTHTPTPTLTPTALPPLPQDAVGSAFNNDDVLREEIAVDPRVPLLLSGTEYQYIAVRSGFPDTSIDQRSSYAYVHIAAGGTLSFNVAPTDRQVVQFELDPMADVFIQGGRYPGVLVELIDPSIEVRPDAPYITFNAEPPTGGSACMSVRYIGPNQVVASCYGGNCTYTVDRTQTRPLRELQQVLMTRDESGETPRLQIETQEIPRSEAEMYFARLSETNQGLNDLFVCGLNELAATPTPRPSPTRTATRTAVAGTATRTPTPPSGPSCGDGQVTGSEACDPPNGTTCDGVCQLLTCGNGVVQPPEQCDDGNNNNTDSCPATCRPARCGDGYTRSGIEQCDDGNTSNTDSCTNACQTARCGDGFTQGTEQCDDGNSSNTDTCTNTCRTARCGDGFTQGTEQCDDGNTSNDDTCTNVCQTARCGDGFIQPGETCTTCAADVGACTPTPSPSPSNTPVPVCGNTIVETGEQCDPPDGGVTCSATCQNVPIVCGNSIVQPGEQCDPPDGGVTCSATCQNVPIVCGNGIVQPGEDCDPANGTTCSATCQNIPIVCGNGIVQPGEDCDPANGTTCSATCQNIPIVCGNGIVQPGEGCDPPDGATCNTSCQPYATCNNDLICDVNEPPGCDGCP